MDELPPLLSTLELVGNKNVSLAGTDDAESIRTFSVSRWFFRGKALGCVGLSIEEVTESPAQFFTILNLGHALGDDEGKG
jgi:hypothetical protein